MWTYFFNIKKIFQKIGNWPIMKKVGQLGQFCWQIWVPCQISYMKLLLICNFVKFWKKIYLATKWSWYLGLCHIHIYIYIYIYIYRDVHSIGPKKHRIRPFCFFHQKCPFFGKKVPFLLPKVPFFRAPHRPSESLCTSLYIYIYIYIYIYMSFFPIFMHILRWPTEKSKET